MSKIVYNRCFGGFSLSEAGLMRYAELKGITLYPVRDRLGFTVYWTVPPEARPRDMSTQEWHNASPEQRRAYNDAYRASTMSTRDFDRADPVLVQVVEELGAKANGAHADLAICELEPGTLYRIDEYDGNERVMAQSDYEWKVA